MHRCQQCLTQVVQVVKFCMNNFSKLVYCKVFL